METMEMPSSENKCQNFSYTIEDIFNYSLQRNMPRAIKACLKILPCHPESLNNNCQINLVVAAINMILDKLCNVPVSNCGMNLFSSSHLLRELRFLCSKFFDGGSSKRYASAIFKLHKVILMHFLSNNPNEEIINKHMNEHLLYDFSNISVAHEKNVRFFKDLKREVMKFQGLVSSMLSNEGLRLEYFKKEFFSDFNEEFWRELKSDVQSYVTVVKSHFSTSKLIESSFAEYARKVGAVDEEAILTLIQSFQDGKYQPENDNNSLRNSTCESCGGNDDSVSMSSSLKISCSYLNPIVVLHDIKSADQGGLDTAEKSCEIKTPVLLKYVKNQKHIDWSGKFPAVSFDDRRNLEETTPEMVLAKPPRFCQKSRANCPRPISDDAEYECTKENISYRCEDEENIQNHRLVNEQSDDDKQGLFLRRSFKKNTSFTRTTALTRLRLRRNLFNQPSRSCDSQENEVTFWQENEVQSDDEYVEESDCSDNESEILSMDSAHLPDFTKFLAEELNYDCQLRVVLERL